MTDPAAPSTSVSDPLAVSGSLTAGSRLLALRLSQYVTLFLAGLVVARALGPELRAQYALPLLLANAVWALVNLSLDTAAGRLLARREATLTELSRLLMAATLVLGTFGCAVTIVFGLLTRDWLLSGASTTAVLLAALMVPLSLSVQQLGTGLLVRVGALRAYGWASASSGVLTLVLVVAIVAVARLTPERGIVVVVVTTFVLAVSLLAILSRYTGAIGLLPGGSRAVASQMFRAGLSLHVAWVAVFLSLRIDVFIVSALTDARQTGLYSLSTSLAEIMFLASWTIVHSAAQTQTEAEPGVAARYTLEFMRQSWSLVMVLAILISCAAYPLIVVLYGAEWSGAVLPFVILSFAAVAFSLEAPVRVLLARIAQPSVIIIPALCGMTVNIALNLVLIPALGISGAALASLTSYWLYAVLLLVRFGRTTGLPVRSAFGRPAADDFVVVLFRGAARRLAGLAGRGRRG